MVDMNTRPSLRVYGGVAGDERQAQRRQQLIEAGLDLLGSPNGDALTVRGVCRHAGLAARYFYEHFVDRDAVTVAVYDQVVDQIATAALTAVTAAPPEARAKTRAGVDTIARTVGDDPRKGRLLFSPTLTTSVLAHRRVQSARLFADLLSRQTQAFYGLEQSTALEQSSQFLVGGLAQTLTAWLDGTIPITRRDLVEHCVDMSLAIAEPAGPGPSH
jgi:AcrR family transcriptional regulator